MAFKRGRNVKESLGLGLGDKRVGYFQMLGATYKITIDGKQGFNPTGIRGVYGVASTGNGDSVQFEFGRECIPVPPDYDFRSPDKFDIHMEQDGLSPYGNRKFVGCQCTSLSYSSEGYPEVTVFCRHVVEG